jgi:HSP20 family protein
VTGDLHQNASELADDARRLLTEIDEQVTGARAASGECRPPVDVVETADSVEVVVDVPGVSAEALRVLIRRNTVLVVGVKLTVPSDGIMRFHLAERSYGRFARVIRLSGAFDAARSRAVATGGQLRVILPRVGDRRGLLIPVRVERE